MPTTVPRVSCLILICSAASIAQTTSAPAPQDTWRIGAPIVTYWAGPGYPGGGALTDTAATRMQAGGWNVVWCSEKELDVVQRHGLRGLLTDPLLSQPALDDAGVRESLAALVDRVKHHPALYAYHLTDEPNAGQFPALAKRVAFLRAHDPGHLAYINLNPTYANNEQLGTKGDTVTAYNAHLRQFVEVVRPALLSYDHYQFTNAGDTPQYFLNLKLVRDRALQAGLPFLNIVQASCWVPGSAASPNAPRVPNGDEMAFLVYTSLAYAAQGISYYVYCYPNHEGGIVKPDNTPTPLYTALQKLNPEFVAIATELQKLKPLGIYHLGMQPPGTQAPPDRHPYTFNPPIPSQPYQAGARVQGILISEFGAPNKSARDVTHLLVVNLDYKTELDTTLNLPQKAEILNAATRKWTATDTPSPKLHLGKGTGLLLRLTK